MKQGISCFLLDVTETTNGTSSNSTAGNQNSAMTTSSNQTTSGRMLNRVESINDLITTTTVKTTVKPLKYKHIDYVAVEGKNARQITYAFYGVGVALILAVMILADGILSTLYKDAQRAKLVDPQLMGEEMAAGKKSCRWLNSESSQTMHTAEVDLPPTSDQKPPSSVKSKRRRLRSTPPVNPADLVDFETVVTKKYGSIPDVISDMHFLKNVQIDIKRYLERTKRKERPKSVIKRTPEVKIEQFNEAFDKALDEKSEEDLTALRRIAYIHQRFRLNPHLKKQRAYLSS